MVSAFHVEDELFVARRVLAPALAWSSLIMCVLLEASQIRWLAKVAPSLAADSRYFAFSYLVWAQVFGDYRYFVTTEVIPHYRCHSNPAARGAERLSDGHGRPHSMLAMAMWVIPVSWGRGHGIRKPFSP